MPAKPLLHAGAVALLLAAAVLPAAAADPKTDRQPSPAADPGDRGPRVTRVGGPTRVKMAEGATHVLIDVRLNGKGPYRLLLDTGAATTVLDEDLVKELGLEPRGTTRIGDPSNPEANEVDRVELASVELGDARFEGVAAVGWRGPSLTAAIGARGVLGLPTFRDCLLTIDYPSREVGVAPGELPPVDGRRVLELAVRPIAEIPVEVAGHRAFAHLDIGNASSLAVPGVYRDSLRTKGEVRTGRGMRASGPVEFTITTLDGDLRLGEAVLHDPEIRFDDKLDHVNVGYGVLRGFALTLDQKHGRVRLVPGTPAAAAAQPAPAEGRRRLGAMVAFSPVGGEVRQVMPGSAAETAGLLAGDVLLEIDGKPADNPAMMAALAGSAPIRLLVLREGKERTLVLYGKEDP